jgi:RNA-binding protein 39
MNGFDLAGRPIRVGLGNDKFTSESTANLLQRFPGGQQPQNSSSGRSHQANATFDRAGGGRDDKGASHTGALDDTDVGGVNFSNYSRDALMRKLARADEPTESNGREEKRPMPPPRTENKTLAVNVPQASRCVVLRNMFDPTQYVYHAD